MTLSYHVLTTPMFLIFFLMWKTNTHYDRTVKLMMLILFVIGITLFVSTLPTVDKIYLYASTGMLTWLYGYWNTENITNLIFKHLILIPALWGIVLTINTIQ